MRKSRPGRGPPLEPLASPIRRGPTARRPATAVDFVLNLLPHLVNGVSLGLLFALIALGFMLIVGVMETINLAHGSLFALGMYFALFIAAPKLGLFPDLQAWYLALPIATPRSSSARISPTPPRLLSTITAVGRCGIASNCCAAA